MLFVRTGREKVKNRDGLVNMDLIIIFLVVGIGTFLVGGAGFLVLLYVRGFHAWVEEYTVFDNKTSRKFRKARFTPDRTHLKTGKDLFPVEEAAADEYKGKPCYTYATVQPGVHIPLHKLSRVVTYPIEKKSKDGKTIDILEKTAKVRDLLPKISYNARAAYAGASDEAGRIYREKENFRTMLLKNIPYIAASPIIIIGLLFIFLITGNLPSEITCACVSNVTATPVY